MFFTIIANVEKSAHLMLRIAVVLRNSFGIRSNFKSLFVPPTRNGFKSLQGVRALNMIALLLCHMVMAKMILPYFNKTEMSLVKIENHFCTKFLQLDLHLPNTAFCTCRACRTPGWSREGWPICTPIRSWSSAVC